METAVSHGVTPLHSTALRKVVCREWGVPSQNRVAFAQRVTVAEGSLQPVSQRGGVCVTALALCLMTRFDHQKTERGGVLSPGLRRPLASILALVGRDGPVKGPAVAFPGHMAETARSLGCQPCM